MLLSYAQCKKEYGNNYQIQKAIKDEKLYKIEKGIYSDKKYVPELHVIAIKYPDSVVTLNTAFYYYNLTDSIPDKYYLMTKKSAVRITDDRVVQIYENSKEFKTGAVRKVENGNSFWIYSKERMLAELLRNKNKMPFDYYKEIIRSYRRIIDELDLPLIQDYIYALPKSRMMMETLQKEVL